jgi:hypothetical protein
MPEPAPVSEPVVAPPEPVVAAAPAPAAAPEPAAAPAPATPSLPQEFNGLKFPNDGVLTRQWMEFLNQMAASK